MKEEDRQRLVEDFPLLYSRVKYFACGSGWFDLIYALSAKIENINRDLDTPCCAAQVKEKFGGLRFYVDHATPEIRELITEAEKKSYELCETCGEEGVMRTGPWLRVLCDKHSKGRKPTEPLHEVAKELMEADRDEESTTRNVGKESGKEN
jgi:hypothetical protein